MSLGVRAAFGMALAVATTMLHPAPARAQVAVPADFVHEVVRGGLDEPTSFTFLPDGRVLFVEQRTGKIRMIVNGAIATTDPIFIVPSVLSNSGERGLLGITVDPGWPDLPFIYVFYNRQGGMRLVRFLANEEVDNPNGQRIVLSSQRIILDSLPDQFGNHNGGTLRFGPDGKLYVSLGDDGSFCMAADSTSLRGQILRLDVDRLPIYGGPIVPRQLITPADNPFVSSPDSNARLVYAFGLRNPFRFHIDPLLGTLFVDDVGDSDFEEITEVWPGDFCGWPWREGDLIRDRPECPEPGGPGAAPYRAPIAALPHPLNTAIATISAGMYRPRAGAGYNWPPEYYALRGDVFFGEYYTGALRRLSWNGTSWGPAAPVTGQPNPDHWATGLYNCSDFNVGPDGSLWWLSQFNEFFSAATGALQRIRYIGPSTAVGDEVPRTRALAASPNPSRGPVDLSFALAAPERVRLALFDLSGRRLRTVFDGVAGAGTTRLTWNGLDDRGTQAPTGMVFARLTRESGGSATARILRVR